MAKIKGSVHSPNVRDCLQCHDPHRADLKNVLVKDGKIVLASSKKEMCAACHDDVVKKIASAKVKHDGAQGDCTDCHSPHAGKRPDPVTACLSSMMNINGATVGRAMGIRILCTDCHNSDDNRESGGAGSNGPHGSRSDTS